VPNRPAPPTGKAAPEGAGGIWTWLAIDADTKLIASWYVGKRDGDAAYHSIADLALRLAKRVQPTSDGHKAYLDAVEQSSGADIDYAMLIKHYDARSEPAVAIALANAPALSNGAWRDGPIPRTSARAISNAPTSRSAWGRGASLA
jgi:hypothetical protein